MDRRERPARQTRRVIAGAVWPLGVAGMCRLSVLVVGEIDYAASRLYDHYPNQFLCAPRAGSPEMHVVFSALHGTFGEDGGMQRLLDAAGGAYAGCDAASSALTMDKALTKEAVSSRGVRVAEGIVFDAEAKPQAAEVARRLGVRVIVKPNNQGSSVGLSVVADMKGQIGR